MSNIKYALNMEKIWLHNEHMKYQDKSQNTLEVNKELEGMTRNDGTRALRMFYFMPLIDDFYLKNFLMIYDFLSKISYNWSRQKQMFTEPKN